MKNVPVGYNNKENILETKHLQWIKKRTRARDFVGEMSREWKNKNRSVKLNESFEENNHLPILETVVYDDETG